MSSASHVPRLGLASRHLSLVLTITLALSGASSRALGQPASGASVLDAKSCTALAAAAARGGGHFPLGRAACGLAAAPQGGPAPASTHAQQLRLYAPAAGALPTASQRPAAPEVPSLPVPRAGTHKPTRLGVPAPRSKPLPPAVVRAITLAPDIDSAAHRHQIDPLLLHAIARIESHHNPDAVSHAGARGLMQVMPATGARFGVNDARALHDAPTNLRVSARYLSVLKQRFPGDLPLVLAAYNAGEGAVERHGRRIPPYAETQAYVRKVLQEYALLRTAAQAADHAPAHGSLP